MRLPFVSRERFEEKCAEVKELRAQIAGMIAAQAKPRPAPAKTSRDQMVDKIAADIGSVITDPAAARAEAERIRREAFG